MKYHLVSIGISRHQNASADLQYAAKDASEFFKLFGLNLPERGYKKLLIDSEATLGQIRSAIGTELKEAVSKDDAFFFFYSGHGAVAASKDDPNTALNYLVPFDATFDFENSCMSIEYLKQVFESLTSKANFIFIDSCFSGCLTTNTKGYPVPKIKAFKSVRSFANTEIGNGTLIFTACKDDQESIEDPEYENGLFTYELFSELQKKRAGDAYDALTIFSPIADRVEVRARDKWNHMQTPTFSGKLQGKVSLPVFKKQLRITPDLLAVPRYTELTDASFPIAQIELPDKKKEKVINDTMDLVIQSKKNDELGDLGYERYCGKLLRNLKKQWEEIFIENGASVQELPNTVAKLEGASFQFMLLGSATAIFGSAPQMKTFSRYAVSILEWTRNKAGLVPLISTPEILVADIIYLVGVLGLASEKLEPLGILMGTKLEVFGDRDVPPSELIQYYRVFYSDALGGYSSKVHDHIRELLNSFDWLSELVPIIEGKVEGLQHQVNLLLSVWMMLKGEHMWPDFARFYATPVMPFVKKIKYDQQFREEIGTLLGVKETEVLQTFADSLTRYRQQGIDNYRWISIGVDDFLRTAEQK